jgi:Ala-tRNA(Pro) deacylase
VLPAPYRINVDQVRDMVGAKTIRLAKEEEFADFFPDCATGAMPPFGNLYGVTVYVDRSMSEEPDMVFRIGTHCETMKIAYADFVRLAQPVVGDFSWQI